MSIIDTFKAYQTPIGAILLFFGPSIYRRATIYLKYRNQPQSPNTARPQGLPPISYQLKVFLVVHTLYHLSHLLIPPFDLFSTSPGLPLLTPNDILRSRLYPNSNSNSKVTADPSGDGLDHHSTTTGDGTNPLLDLLLVRLQNLDTRFLYIRYGHSVLQGCLWCRSSLDYLISSAPDILARYTLAVLVILCLGNEGLFGKGANHRGKRWGSVLIWVLTVGCISELAVRYLWEFRIVNGDCLHLSHNIHLVRTTLLLCLPLLHTFLPHGPIPPNPASLIAALQNTQNTQRLTSLLRETVQQDDHLQALWTEAGRTERTVREAVRGDTEVQQAIADYGIGQVSVNHARRWVEEGWNGLLGRGESVRNRH